jgi:hypothetical protein
MRSEHGDLLVSFKLECGKATYLREPLSQLLPAELMCTSGDEERVGR